MVWCSPSPALFPIPSKDTQVNLLKNVEQVFHQLKLLVGDEGQWMQDSLVGDMRRIEKRATATLTLIEKYTLLNLSTTINSICMLDSRAIVNTIIREGVDVLHNVCITNAANQIRTYSMKFQNITESAMVQGEHLLHTMYSCSSKNNNNTGGSRNSTVGHIRGSLLYAVACYNGIISRDVEPVKEALLGAINEHKVAHYERIAIRTEFDDCIDSTLASTQKRIETLYNQTLYCDAI